MSLRTTSSLAILSLFLLAPMTAGYAVEPQTDEKSGATVKTADEEYYELYKALADTIDQVERNYVKPIDRRELMEAAIQGIITKLDPYSSYIGPDEFTGFRNSVENQFGGIGIQITVDDGALKVASPLVGTPAYRAGIQAGDRIVKIEGESTENFSIDDAVRKLKGPIGSSVTLTVRHALTGKTETFTLKRETIHLDTVMGDHRREDDAWDFMLDADKGIGYIRVTAFGNQTAGQIKKALEQLKSQKMRGLILDLRFNPGGLLTSAVEVCDLFISKGRIVSTQGRNTPERTWDAVEPGTYSGFPMAVLVNRYSASASEIVAACLQDHGRAVVIGERTWGKGSVQNVIELERGKTALKLTTSSYKRPNGENIHRFPNAKESDQWGVKPDKGMEVALSTNDMLALIAQRAEREAARGKQSKQEPEDRKQDEPDKGKSEEPSDKPTDMQAAGDEKAATKDAAETHNKPAAEPEEATKSGRSKRKPRKFVDLQLQKALEYLSTELSGTP